MAKIKKPPRLPTTREGWISRWKRSLKLIRRSLDEVWEDRFLYRHWRETIEANHSIDKSDQFLWLIERTYWYHMLTTIRRCDDHDSRSHSLLTLMREIKRHASLLTRTWFVGRFTRSTKPTSNAGRFRLMMGEMQFRDHWSGKTSISELRIERDIRALKTACRKVRKFTNTHVAHSSRRPYRKPLPFREIDDAFDAVFDLMSRYHALVFNTSWGHPLVVWSGKIFDSKWRA